MAYEEAQEFLARVVPWPAQTDPPEFFVNIHHPFTLLSGKRVYPGRAARTLKEAINFVQWKASQNVDIYVCMSSQRHGKAKTDKQGRAYWNAIRNHQHAVLHRSFYIDVDVKPGGFATTQEASDAFGQFLEKTDLPFPTFLVPSGSGGFHAHWVIDEPIPTAVWMPVALGLVGAMQHYGFVVDYGCTTDIVRLLRVPNTFNYKHDPPRPVTLAHSGDIYSLDRIASRVLQYAGVKPPRAVKTPPSAKINDTLIRHVSNISALVPFTELMANQQESLPSLAEVRKVCPFVTHAHTTGGKDYRQPLWWETAKIAFYLREGEAALHTMARAHADYRPDENHELYERIVRERTPIDDYGWPQCDTIMAQGSPVCAGCQWMTGGQAHGNSPFNFLTGTVATPGTPPVTAPVTFGDLPDGYFHDDDGCISTLMENKKGDEVRVRVSNYPMRNLRVTYDPPMILFETMVDQRDWFPVSIMQTVLSDTRALGRNLSEFGMTFAGSRLKLMGEMLASFAEQLRDRKINSIPIEAPGWARNLATGEPEAFVYSKRFNCSGATPAIMRDREMQKMFQPTGTIEPWLAAMKMINDQHRPALETIVAAGFGSVFMEFTGEAAVLIGAHSSATARQKSTAMRTGQAIWGDPVLGMQNFGDTSNSANRKLSLLHNLPGFWDELKTTPKAMKEYVELLQALTTGKDRSRLTRQSQLMESLARSSLLITASNVSLLGAALDNASTTLASAYRAFDFEVPANTGIGIREDAGAINVGLNHNYGHAGVIFAEWLGKNAASMLDRVQTTLQMVRRDVSYVESERYWTAAMASILLGAQIPNNLGLARFDVDTLYDFLVKSLDHMRRIVDTSNVDIDRPKNLTALLMDFINTNRRNLLITDHMPSGPGNPRGTINVKNIADIHGTQKIWAQYAETDQILRLSRREYTDYLKLREINPYGVIKQFAEMLGARIDVKAALGAGTSYRRGTEHLIEFDMSSRPELQGLL